MNVSIVAPAMRVGAIGLIIAMPGGSDAATAADLFDAMRLPEMIEVMREEGLAYGDELAEQTFPGNVGQWPAMVSDIYDTTRMGEVIEARFDQALAGTDITPLLAYFESDAGQRVLRLELGARRAMIDPLVEDTARAAYRAADPEELLQQQITRFIEVGDLLETNVASALNASLRFYSGMADGGLLTMTESEMLADVWAQEAETRADTDEWLHAFLQLAYKPLTQTELKAYIDLTATDEGQALNQAMFDAFGAAYDDISYALGYAMAQQMKGQDL